MYAPTTTEQDNLQSRLPDPGQLFPELAGIAAGMFKATGNGSIPQTTIHLVQLRAGQIVGSTYHTVRQAGALRKAGETEQRITAVASWWDAPYFTDAERVALELVEAILTPNPFGERVDDELYAAASAHYDDKALWTLTLAIGQICFFIPVALIAKPIPGQEPHDSKERRQAQGREEDQALSWRPRLAVQVLHRVTRPVGARVEGSLPQAVQHPQVTQAVHTDTGCPGVGEFLAACRSDGDSLRARLSPVIRTVAHGASASSSTTSLYRA